MKSVIIPLVIIFSVGCTTFEKRDEKDAKRVVVKMVNAIDSKNWDLALEQFDEAVFVDYSSMTGRAGSNMEAKKLVNGWKNLLEKTETHHMLTNFEVSRDGNVIETYSHVYATHNSQGIKHWDIYGRYHHKLQKRSGKWKITFMKLLVHGQKGNLKFLEQVSKK